jgi:hypothetical protein
MRYIKCDLCGKHTMGYTVRFLLSSSASNNWSERKRACKACLDTPGSKWKIVKEKDGKQ